MPRTHVVLVHGIRTSATMWRRQLAALAAHDVSAVAIDLPGHGTRLGEPFTLDAACDTIAGALSDIGPTTAPRLLVGLSLGGYLSVEVAARHPELIDGLVAASCGTRPRGPGLAGYRALAGVIGRLPDRGRALNDAMARIALSPEAVRDVVAGGVALDVMQPALSAVGGIDLESALARIPRPIWFVNGRFDHFRFEERRLARLAADARLVIVPGATHLVSLSRPEEFTAAVLDAVAELERRAASSGRRD